MAYKRIEALAGKRKRYDLVGKRFGKLVVVAFDKIHSNGSKSLWKTECDCGGKTVSFGNNLTRGLATSCGCNHKNYCKPGAAFRSLFAHYKRSAKLRSLSFSVSESDFKCLTSSLCHYCGDKPSQKR